LPSVGNRAMPLANTALFNYGMVPYDFLQARYVSAGLLYLASTVGLTGFVFLMIHLTRKKFYLHDKIDAEFKSAAVILFVFGSVTSWIGYYKNLKIFHSGCIHR
jgi:hypothetical protein